MKNLRIEPQQWRFPRERQVIDPTKRYEQLKEIRSKLSKSTLSSRSVK
ncbi:hypothetical protein [Aquiluna sp. KACHI24]|nr:hypothetical protein [Aquiluna sp. KACHI24]